MHVTAHRHITFPTEKSRPEIWGGKYMGKSTRADLAVDIISLLPPKVT